VIDLYPTRDRRGLLVAIDKGQVYWSLSGLLTWRAPGRGQNQRVGRRVRELVDAGWVRELGDDRPAYELTDTGRAVLDGGAR
jgi:hypothetical protein